MNEHTFLPDEDFKYVCIKEILLNSVEHFGNKGTHENKYKQ